MIVDHHHDHEANSSKERAFVIGMVANLAFVLIEVIYGLRSHSMALIADAGHNAGDVLGLGLSWGATILATRKPSKRRTYGLRKASVLAALANAMMLVAATGAIAWESIGRLREPVLVRGTTVIVVASLGVVVNAGCAVLFMRDRKGDLNVGSAFLHLTGDAAIAFGVVVAGVVMLLTGWSLLDPIVSLVVSVVVLVSSWGLLRSSVNLIVDAVPEGIDLDEVRLYLVSLVEVKEVHDIHVWAMSTTQTALTAHFVMRAEPCPASFLSEVEIALHRTFGIDHVTIQLDPLDSPPCKLAPDDSV